MAYVTVTFWHAMEMIVMMFVLQKSLKVSYQIWFYFFTLWIIVFCSCKNIKCMETLVVCFKKKASSLTSVLPIEGFILDEVRRDHLFLPFKRYFLSFSMITYKSICDLCGI